MHCLIFLKLAFGRKVKYMNLESVDLFGFFPWSPGNRGENKLHPEAISFQICNETFGGVVSEAQFRYSRFFDSFPRYILYRLFGLGLYKYKETKRWQILEERRGYFICRDYIEERGIFKVLCYPWYCERGWLWLNIIYFKLVLNY